jgi:hypothetical protein
MPRSETSVTAPTITRIRSLLADEFADTGAPVISTALLLMDTRTGQEDLRLFAPVAQGEPRHEACVWLSAGPEHGPFALDLIEAIHSHRLRHWRPCTDAFVDGVVATTTRRSTGQIGWAVNHLDQGAHGVSARSNSAERKDT